MGFQLFPAFSVFFDARVTEYGQQQAEEKRIYDARVTEYNQQQAEQKQIYEQKVKDWETRQKNQPPRIDPAQQALYELGLAQYRQDFEQFKVKQANHEKDKDSAQQRIRDLQENINSAQSGISNALNIVNNPGTFAARQAAAAEAERLGKQIESDQASQVRERAALQKLIDNPPVAPVQPDLPKAGPAPAGEPKPEPTPAGLKPEKPKTVTDVQFMIDTLESPNSKLAIFISLIFPIIVFGAGFVLARNEGGDVSERERATELAGLDLTRELRECASLAEAKQSGYAEGIKTEIRVYVAAFEAAKIMANAITTTHLESMRVLDTLDMLNSIKKQVITSGIKKEVKTALQTLVVSL